jgi:cytochrome c peroxidase
MMSLSKSSMWNTLRYSVAGATRLCCAASISTFALAQDNGYEPANYAWQAAAISHAQRMRAFFDRGSGQQTTPPVIPAFEIDSDPSGSIATTQPGGATQTSQNAFFANLGTNNRTCFTCHEPQTGWSVSAASGQARFNASQGSDPIFRLVDGATCPTNDVSTVTAQQTAYSLLLNKGLIRIGLPVPTNAEYQIVSVVDPYGCNTNPFTGLTNYGYNGPTTGIVSVYRRPLPSTSLGFLTTIMWDGREPSLTSQAIDATLIHAQAIAGPTTAQQQQIVNFESGIFTAQVQDNSAQNLKALGADGGPDALAALLPGFIPGVNDPFGGHFSSQIFDLFQAWEDIGGGGPVNAARQSIARGEDLFNNLRSPSPVWPDSTTCQAYRRSQASAEPATTRPT